VQAEEFEGFSEKQNCLSGTLMLTVAKNVSWRKIFAFMSPNTWYFRLFYQVNAYPFPSTSWMAQMEISQVLANIDKITLKGKISQCKIIQHSQKRMRKCI
jgi:hypothetical protein